MDTVVVIGAGVAGVEAASQLSGFGHEVILVEKNSYIGGKLAKWDHLFPSLRPASEILTSMEEKINQGSFKILKNTEITDISRHNGRWILKTGKGISLEPDAVVVASGFGLFDARRKEEYGYNIYNNVITSVDLEDKLKRGEKIRMTNGKAPGRIAFIHCVGSRDEKSGNHHCSKVCCITGVKQAIELRGILPQAEIFCFYMDLRMYGKDFEELYREAQETYDVQFIRGRLSEASENIDESLLIKAEDTLSGRPLKMNVDLMILLIGMEAGEDTINLCKGFKLERDRSGFIKPKDIHVRRNISSQEGVFLAGTCTCPMTIGDSIDNARAAAIEVHNYLKNKHLP
jgi:heterodisulfide reductase subunit A